MKHDIVKPLLPSELRWKCALTSLPFKSSTKELKPLHRIVGQERAVEALELGARIRSQGYNVWASGVVGTGRMTTIRQILDSLQGEKAALSDFAYVNNFRQPESPVLLRFSAGEGRVFTRMMDDVLTVVRRRIPQLFEEVQFQAERKEIIQRYQLREKKVLEEFDVKIRPSGFVVGQLQEEDGTSRTEVFAVIDGKPVSIDELDALVQEGKMTMDQAKALGDAYSTHRDELADISRRSMRVMVDFRKELKKHDQAAVGVLLKSIFDDIRTSFPRDRVTEYLNGVTKHILERLDEYVRVYQTKQSGVVDENVDEMARTLERLTSVNLIVDNYDVKAAPVIVETVPTYSTLFGTIERRVDARGFAVSDFTHIRAGALLRADGGYIVLNAMDILVDVNIWTSLKKVMLYGRLDIQALDSQFQLNNLKPDFINVDVKIILLGDPSVYLALWAADEDFHKMFKVHAEFDSETKRSAEMIRHYCAFICQISTQENLLHCDRGAAAAIVEWAVAFTESKEKISLQFSYAADLLREASHFARQSRARIIRAEHVRHALEMRHRRSSRADEEIRKSIAKGILLIDVKGERVGQINGLTVYSSGIVSFGKPARITTTVSAGNAGIINIEREVEMSGPIHSKGVLILSGLLRALFSRAQSISFSASIAFEQSYGGIDGDSASTAEIIALLSAISNVPIRQDYAMTGSINQKGDIQPVGGLNEKITGFYEVCKDRGLTGTQGVVMPTQNVGDLMLSDEIIDAVKKGKFRIYPVSRLEEAVELMMGMPAGKIAKNGKFPPDTVFAKVQANLDVLHEASRTR
ncbi:MAG: AAA family ATPase [Candidatus Kapabacteria bacterium]|nr:AAA family ATPase [Candidatus Kapabacteria bacterium]